MDPETLRVEWDKYSRGEAVRPEMLQYFQAFMIQSRQAANNDGFTNRTEDFTDRGRSFGESNMKVRLGRRKTISEEEETEFKSCHRQLYNLKREELQREQKKAMLDEEKQRLKKIMERNRSLLLQERKDMIAEENKEKEQEPFAEQNLLLDTYYSKSDDMGEIEMDDITYIRSTQEKDQKKFWEQCLAYGKDDLELEEDIIRKYFNARIEGELYERIVKEDITKVKEEADNVVVANNKIIKIETDKAEQGGTYSESHEDTVIVKSSPTDEVKQKSDSMNLQKPDSPENEREEGEIIEEHEREVKDKDQKYESMGIAY